MPRVLCENCTASVPASCPIFDGAQGYRLGDVTGSRWFRHTPGGMHFHLRQFPDSLAAKFLTKYGHGTLAYRAYYNSSCWSKCSKTGYCQCYVPRAHALHELLLHETVPERLAHTAAVHLRVGDVVDQSPYDLDTMLQHPTSFSTRCSSKEAARGCLSIHPVVYVQPLSRYDGVMARLRELSVRHVVVVAASSVNQTSHARSCALVRRMGQLFHRGGFAVSFRVGQHPDDDFRFLVGRVAALVPTLSGFSGLAGQVAKKLGATIVMPQGLELPTTDLIG